MSTNKSQNLKLHLWDPEDNFLRAEFNENFAAIDAAVATAKTELSAQIQTAQQTANTARAEAAVLPYATGVYTGNGYGQFIELGFRPSIVIIGEYHDTSDSSYAIGLCSLHGLQSAGISIRDTGFEVAVQLSRKYPATNLQRQTYYYIAFR
ncbi:MAG: hypothetical protein HFF18_05915 [Oscillospiraceae bacterium]|nr:hypothetical protein [Oscillospiraceae bacterium]